jgi:enoyl-CoA hydratase
VRLPRLIGHSHALDLILTGRGVQGDEARSMGLANRLVDPGTARSAALDLARDLDGVPPLCLRSDRRASYRQWGLELEDALALEYDEGVATIRSGETQAGASRFADGAGRHGRF